MVNIAEIMSHVEHFQRRVIQDALQEATADYWLRRAEQFEAAKPRLDDYAGGSSTDDLRRRWYDLDEIVRACRAKASVSLIPTEEIDREVIEALREVA